MIAAEKHSVPGIIRSQTFRRVKRVIAEAVRTAAVPTPAQLLRLRLALVADDGASSVAAQQILVILASGFGMTTAHIDADGISLLG